jgi:hypothetical protein
MTRQERRLAVETIGQSPMTGAWQPGLAACRRTTRYRHRSANAHRDYRGHAKKILHDHARHFNDHRPHQGRNQLAPDDEPTSSPWPHTRIERHEAVSGLNEYRNAA